MADENNDVKVTEVEIDNLETLLGGASAENVLTPEQKDKKFFEKKSENGTPPPSKEAQLINEEEEEEEEEELDEEETNPDGTPKKKPEAKKPVPANANPNVDLNDLLEEEQGDDGKPTGKKLDKRALVNTVGKLIEKGKLKPFDDDKDLKDYKIKDFFELIEANLDHIEESAKVDTPKKFMASLSPELRLAYEYERNGGDDMKGFFRALSEVEEARELDPSKEHDQTVIARNFLRMTDFGTEEEIENEINSYKDKGELAAKAQQFKPKLDKRRQDQVNQRLQQQDNIRKQHEAAASQYVESVFSALEPGEINGIKLDKRIQSALYHGLTQAKYPSMSGRPTNYFGHLIEHHQYVKPNHGLIAEALWLLMNPEEYKAKIREQGGKKTNEDTVRKLKFEQNNKKNGVADDEHEDSSGRKKNTISRNSNGFFRPR